MNIKEKLQEHQSFASASIMHAAVEEHVQNNSLNESALRVLRVLEFRSKMVPGVCWLKYATIAEVIGKSVSTVRRAIRALCAAGIIEKIAVTREKKGGDGANIYVILPFLKNGEHADEHAGMNTRNVAENPHDAEVQAGFSEPKEDSLKEEMNNNICNNNVQRVDLNNQILDVSFVPETVPESFKQLAARFWGDAGTIYNLWRKAEMAARSLGCDVCEDAAIDSLKQAIFALKHRSIRGSFEGYYYGILKQKLVQAHRAKIAQERRLFDWVAATKIDLEAENSASEVF